MKIILIALTVLAISPMIRAQKTDDTKRDVAAASKTHDAAPEPPKTLTSHDLTKEFVSLAGEAIDSVDNLIAAEDFTRTNFERAQMDNRISIQKLRRAVKTRGQKYIADAIEVYSQDEELYVATRKFVAFGGTDAAADLKTYKQDLDKDRIHASCLIMGTNVAVDSCSRKPPAAVYGK